MIPSLTPSAYELHFLAGLAIALLAGRRWMAWIIILAISKEGFDLVLHGKPDVLDIVFTLAGGATYKIVEWKRRTSSC